MGRFAGGAFDSGRIDPAIPPLPDFSTQRIMGLYRGQTWMRDDFDAPMTDEFTEGKL